jgi:NAD(P)-dependent dehydrogenase (short-subunit alcohol dehydrogenase family)
VVAGDASVEATARQAVAEAAERFGGLDILVKMHGRMALVSAAAC